MADARNIGRNFNTVCQPDARDFAQRRIRLLRSLGIYAGANSTFLRTRLQRRARRLVTGPFTACLHELIKRWHYRTPRRGTPRHKYVHRDKDSLVAGSRTGLTPSHTHARSLDTEPLGKKGVRFPVLTVADDGDATPKLGGAPFRLLFPHSLA